MKVILYIGHHKVGSSALQKFLAQNWLTLAKSGILYPSLETRGLAHNLSMAIKGSPLPEPPDMNVQEPHSALAYKMISEVSDRDVPPQFKFLPPSKRMKQALRNQVRQLQPRAIILCSEVFSNFGQVDPSLIDQLREIFPKAQFVIYCALRRIDDYLISWHGQRLKAGEKLEALDKRGAAQYFDTIHLDFRSMVEPWVERMPNARIIVRNYADIFKAGGSTQDFTTQIPVKFPEALSPVGSLNKSLPRAAMEIIRRGNHALPPLPARALCAYFLRLDASRLPIANDQVEMLGSQQREEILKRFMPVHEYLSKLTGVDAFFPDINDIRRSRPVPAAEATTKLLDGIKPSDFSNRTLGDFISKLRSEILA